MTAAEAILETRDVQVHHGGGHVVHGVSLQVNSGEVVAILGTDGMAKSVLLRAVMGLIMPSGGEVIFKGQAIEGRTAHEIGRLGIGYVPKERRVFRRMTVYENLEVGRRLDAGRKADHQWNFDRVFALLPGVAAVKDQFAGALSPGDQQMLVIARTLMGNPEVLLLDEPDDGLESACIECLVGIVQDLRRQGLSILLSPAALSFAALTADRGYLLQEGVVVQEGSIAGFPALEAAPPNASAQRVPATAGA